MSQEWIEGPELGVVPFDWSYQAVEDEAGDWAWVVRCQNFEGPFRWAYGRSVYLLSQSDHKCRTVLLFELEAISDDADPRSYAVAPSEAALSLTELRYEKDTGCALPCALIDALLWHERGLFVALDLMDPEYQNRSAWSLTTSERHKKLTSNKELQRALDLTTELAAKGIEEGRSRSSVTSQSMWLSMSEISSGSVRAGRAGRPDIYWAELARDYVRLLDKGDPPIPDLAEARHLGQSAIRNQVMLARRKGFLSKALPRKASGSVTKKAKQVLKSHGKEIE